MYNIGQVYLEISTYMSTYLEIYIGNITLEILFSNIIVMIVGAVLPIYTCAHLKPFGQPSVHQGWFWITSGPTSSNAIEGTPYCA